MLGTKTDLLLGNETVMVLDNKIGMVLILSLSSKITMEFELSTLTSALAIWAGFYSLSL